MVFKHTYLRNIFTVLQLFSRFVGLRPYDFNKKTRRIENSKFNTIWAIIFNVIVIYFYLQSINLYLNLLEDTFRQSFISAISTKYVFYSNIITFTLIYILQNLFKFKILLIYKKLENFILKTSIADAKLNYTKDVCVFVFKTIFNNVALILAACSNVQKNIGTYFNSIMIVIPTMVIYSVSNLFYGMNVGGKYYFQLINNKIEKIVLKIHLLKTTKKSTYYEKTKLYCDLSDQIDEISKIHGELCDLCKEFMKLYQIQVLLTFLTIFTSLLAQVFNLLICLIC